MPGPWEEWGNHILSELKDLKAQSLSSNTTQIEILKELAGLKIKAGIWGGLGAALVVVPAAVMLILRFGG